MVTMLPLLLVFEPQPSLSSLLADQLADWKVETKSVLSELLAGVADAEAVLIDGPAGTLPAEIRRAGLIGPIFVLDHGEAAPGIVAITRPLRLAPLLAKLAQPNGAAIDGVWIGRWQVDSAQRAICLADRCERLTDREFDILKLLLEQRGQAISREALLGAIWHYHPEADSHTVETHIWRLRQKLETDPATPEHLVTEAEGYRLVR